MFLRCLNPPKSAFQLKELLEYAGVSILMSFFQDATKREASYTKRFAEHGVLSL